MRNARPHRSQLSPPPSTPQMMKLLTDRIDTLEKKALERELAFKSNLEAVVKHQSKQDEGITVLYDHVEALDDYAMGVSFRTFNKSMYR